MIGGPGTGSTRWWASMRAWLGRAGRLNGGAALSGHVMATQRHAASSRGHALTLCGSWATVERKSEEQAGVQGARSIGPTAWWAKEGSGGCAD
ncbi:hypothetical protein E2562_034501 [Oryza meyeriana var. granulata]|uniref:Uncharacterized protein n=1 Tax=Oryza meyeriana var. granulata TaxID=110450 RepID=A0A6G1CW76_9ORYZ|nr:hypothetical protein E2562_034501 [Oryza meyeriana var. granulata]